VRLKLNDLTVKNLVPSEKQVTYWDATLPTFGLRVSPGGTKTWTVMVGKERRRIKLGNYPIISVAVARDEAKKLLAEITLGYQTPRHWPLNALRNRFLAEKVVGVRPRTYDSYRSHLNALPEWLASKHVGDITPDDIRRAISKQTPSVQHHTMVILKMLYRYAEGQGYDGKNPVAAFSQKSQAHRTRTLSDTELVQVWHTLGDDIFSRTVKLLILCGFRKNEVQHLIIEGDVARLPAAFSKNRIEHLFPLPSMAVPLFDRPLTFNGWSRAKERLDKNSGVTNYTLHDLRRGYVTRLASLGVQPAVISKLVGHVTGGMSPVQLIYNQHTFLPEMRAAVDSWERHLQSLLARAST